ncbi:hypothetical protein CJF30_00001318 [Rutstroemia sp. NJR-2017a BBW]|nr:hypothetical protein CJF30_00001318 [Rutstroemia sp. NJR-2017a BBW]
MALSNRDLLSFPPGNNASDTFIEGVHYNLTTLRHWNYTYYSNRTFSNGSLCFILFEPYTPHLLQNGTFLNSTSCWSPIEPMQARSKIGLALGILSLISLMFTLINLRKHGRIILPRQSRFRGVSRRWQWYWMLVVGTCGGISGLTAVDVDRYFLPELPFAMTNFFWFLMLPTTMAVVWESVRHWGSWQERQMIDPNENQFALREDDRRSKVELLIPVVFYFFSWMNFFMTIPRSWGSIEKQRDSDQARLIAEPTATDLRFKIGAFFLLVAWMTTIYSLQHSIFHYRSHQPRIFSRVLATLRYTPTKLLLGLVLSLVMIGYSVAISFEFSISPLKLHPNLSIMYPLGWGPILLILFIYEIYGYIDPNEDIDLLRQRRRREVEIDREMGIIKRPRWWARLHGDNTIIGVHDRIAENVAEIGAGGPTTGGRERGTEMDDFPLPPRNYSSRPYADTEVVREAIGSLFPPTSAPQPRFVDDRSLLRESEASSVTQVDSAEQDGSNHSSVTASVPPQRIRSMLDV